MSPLNRLYYISNERWRLRQFGALVVSVAVLLAACDSATPPQQTSKNPANSESSPGVTSSDVSTKPAAGVKSIAQPQPTDARVLNGRKIYRSNCTVCHGIQAEGDKKWRSKNADGTWPPPPLNGSGHTWHHSKRWLFNFIKHGSPAGKGNMPAWKNKLSDSEIEDTVLYLQSLWPKEVYVLWLEIDQREQGQ